MKLSETVSLVASGTAGCSYTHPNDCNVYAVRCGTKFVLIDSGAGVETSRIVDILREDGFDPERMEALLLTHGHLDHAGGAAWIHKHLGVPVFASAETAAALESGDEDFISLSRAKAAGIYSGDFVFQPCPVQRQVSDGDEWKIGDTSFRVLATPGHSCDMITYFIDCGGRTLAFPGDTVFHGGTILLSDTHDCDPAAYSRSLRRLASKFIHGLFPGHGLWSLRDGQEQIRKCLPFLDRLLLPPNLTL